MNKRLFRITILATIVVLIVILNGGLGKLFKSSTARAVGDLSVDWGVAEGEAIFNIVNFAPGESKTQAVDIYNDAETMRPVGIRGVLNEDTANLSTALMITISQGATELYGGSSPTGPKTLAQFFSESAHPDGIFLSNLTGETSTQYTFTVTFPPESGNEFQNAQIIFDLYIGISIPIPAECATINFRGTPIFGTKHNDNIHGTNGNDLIIAFEGNDSIHSGNGRDCIIAGAGNDTISSQNGADVVFGNEGDDRIHTGNDSDVVVGGADNDSIRSENGNDIVHGNAGRDTVWGGNGDDILSGGEGQDTLNGDHGDDEIFGNEDNDSLFGDSGKDKLIGDGGFDNAHGSSGFDQCDAERKLSCEW